jgi:hypothetical protein
VGRDQRIIDELRAFERLTLELAEESRVLDKVGAVREMAANYWSQGCKRDRG